MVTEVMKETERNNILSDIYLRQCIYSISKRADNTGGMNAKEIEDTFYGEDILWPVQGKTSQIITGRRGLVRHIC